MRICFINNLYPPYILGGAEIIVQKTVQEMDKLGHDIIVITTSPDDVESITHEGNIKIYYLNTTKVYPTYQQTSKNPLLKPLWHYFDLWNKDTLIRIKEILEKEEIDIVNINNYKGLSLSCFEAPKKLDIPVVFTSHDFSLICPRANLITGKNTLCKNKNVLCTKYVEKQKKLLNDNVDLLISPSNFMIDKFKDNGLFNNIPSVKIPLGIDYKTEQSEKHYDSINLLYIGTLGKHKGVDTLINAFKMIPIPDIRLNLVGKGPDQEEFKEMAKDDSRIIFHGFIKNENIMSFYKSANMVIVPSICYDNSPLVIYESFSTGTPVIGSRIGGIPELIKDGYNGFLFEPGNSKDLKDKLLKIKDRKLLKELENNATESIPKNSIKIMTNKILEQYKKILNN